MKTYWNILVMAGMLAVQGALGASADFSRYALILDRRPFGSVTEAERAGAVVTVEKPPAFVKDLRMCAITESPAGVRVGFVNIRQKPPQPYYLYVGDSEDEIELVDADYEREGALLRKGAEQYWLYMRGDRGSLTVADEASAGGIPMPGKGGERESRGAIRSESGTPAGGSSYAERRRRRLEAMRRRAAEARELTDEEIEKRLQEYQMDLIRQGKTPLPIPLTEAMDQQLVEEGVLPPWEE